jgi:oxygen-dependent protoporphyrinogen oxidase
MVAGGGIAGLAIASELAEVGIDVTVLEASQRPGGNVRTERSDGYLCESGPNGFLDDAAATLGLCSRLALDGRIVRAREEGRRRFIVRDGKLRRLSSALSFAGRLRMLGGALVPLRRPQEDESVSAYAERTLGREAARVLIDAAVTGTWAGNADELSVRSAFPELVRLRVPKGRLASFREGLEELPIALRASLGTRLRVGAPVTSIEPLSTGGLRAAVSGSPPIDARAIVLACPAWAAAPLVLTLNPELSTLLSGIPSVPVAVVHLGFAATDAPGLSGFGFLVPRGEHPSVLGVLIPSNIFPNRAPEGRLLATVMIGGARDPSAVGESDQVLFDTAGSALRAFAGVRASPRFAYAIRHERAIPQYAIGHAARLAAVEAQLWRHPGLFLAGNSYRGISINACLAEARPIAERVAAALR